MLQEKYLKIKKSFLEKGEFPDIILETAIEADFSQESPSLVSAYMGLFNPIEQDFDNLDYAYQSTLSDWYDGLSMKCSYETGLKGDDFIAPVEAHKQFSWLAAWKTRCETLLPHIPLSWLMAYYESQQNVKDSDTEDETPYLVEESFEKLEFDIPLEKEELVQVKTKTHQVFKDEKDNYPKYHPLVPLLEGGPYVEYSYSKVGFGRHNGQLKLMMSFVSFLNQFKELPGSVLFYGAAPGYAIVALAELLGIHLHCVDDYPVATSFIATYYTFDQSRRSDFLNDVVIDGVFVDTYFPEMTTRMMYDDALSMVCRFSGVQYSIKRYVNMISSMKRLNGSRFYPLVYTRANTQEIREAGYYFGDETPGEVNGLEFALRDYAQFKRHGVGFGREFIDCTCSDCVTSDYQLVSLLMSNGILELAAPLKRLFMMVQNGTYSTRDKEMIQYLQSLTQKDITFRGDLAYSKRFVWNYGKFDDYSAFFYTRKSLVQSSAVSSGTDPGGIKRYYLPPRIAVLKYRNDTRMFAKMAVPLVRVSVSKLGMTYFAPQHLIRKVFRWDDSIITPACLSCGYAEHDFHVDIRDRKSVV